MDNDSDVWKWLKTGRAKPLPKTIIIDNHAYTGTALIAKLEEFWNTIWPGRPDDNRRTKEEELEASAPPRSWPAAPELPPLTGKDVLKAYKAAANKATGLDGWTARELALAPLRWHDEIAAMLMAVENGAAWPHALQQWRQTHLHTGKDDGRPSGWRPISIAPLVYRAWCTVRIRQLRTWLTLLPASI